MSELTAFLLARIADDEWCANHMRTLAHDYGDETIGYEWTAYALNAGKTWDKVARLPKHVTPARVLAECEAKRRIVEAVESGWYDPDVRVALEYLAQPYADHSDFRDEWRLDAPERTEP